jgi:non-specific protein-tyrosine kinase
LSDLLVNGEKVIDGHLQDTGIENLRLLPSGPLPPNPSELLGSQSMARLIERLEGVADIVLFDMAPVLPVTDAAVLAPQVDGILLIADAGRTRRGAARRAVENLRRVGANLLGVALNRIKLGGRSGYYYNYNYYYSSDDEGRQRKRRRRS